MQKEILQDGTGNYLKVLGTGREGVSDKIFSYQDIKGFLPLEVRRINGQKEYIYDISGKMSLTRYLDRGDFSLPELRRLFGQLLDMADCVEEYLLDSEGIVIQEDFLYLDMAAGEWEGIYSEENVWGLIDSVGRLLETIMEKMNQKDRELVFFVYGMHKLTREAGCTRGMLREYVSDRGDAAETVWQDPPGQDTPRRDVPEPAPAPKSRHNAREILPKERKRPRGTLTIRGCLLPGMILAAGIVLPCVLWWMGMFQLPLSRGTDWSKAVGAAVFFLAVAGYGAWKTSPADSKSKKEPGVVFHDEKTEKKKVCLIPKIGPGEPIPIFHFPYVLGRERERVDAVLRDDGVSQIHAQILQEAGTVMVVDEESERGTFHNDRRLVPWQKAPLQDGDFLRFADMEYVVEITQSEYVM